jgi:hypothetical protein
MGRIFQFAFVGTCVVLATGFVEAQQQQNQQQNQGQPNQSGTGTQKGGVFTPYSQTPWFSNQDIRQQLKFDEQQFNRLNKAYGESWNRYQQKMGELGKNLTPEQRTERMRNLERDFYNNFATTTNQYFTDPAQRERFNQLHWQYLGYNAFNDPQIQQKLNLTPEQRQKLDQFSREWHTQMNNFNRSYQTDREGTIKRFNEARQQAMDRLNDVLTKQQQQTWQQMVGDPYNFQPNIYFQSSQATKNSRGQ